MNNESPLSGQKKISILKIILNAGIAFGIILFITLISFLIFPELLVDRIIKPRIISAFTQAYPAYSIRIAEMSYSVTKNSFGFDTVALSAVDGTFEGTIHRLSISGIEWKQLIWGSSIGPEDAANAIVKAQDIVLNFPLSQYELRCERLYLSAPDSEMVAGSIKFYSLQEDERFFAKSTFRQTRFRFDIPEIEITGLDYLSMVQGSMYRAKSIHVHDLFADILVNMDKPYNKKSSKPQMPNEALSSMNGKVSVGSVNIINGRLKYCERYAVKATPGVITFDKVNVLASGIAGDTARPDTIVINAEAVFMNAGTMKLAMVIPLASTDFSLRYHGSLSRMNVAPLNSFIVPAERRRIKSGILQSAAFDIKVTSGKASGVLRVVYKDLSIAVLNKNTGSEHGILDRISSFIGKIFVIRGTNIPDEHGVMKIGEIQYKRDPDDYFLQFVWFALRSGVGDVVGF